MHVEKKKVIHTKKLRSCIITFRPHIHACTHIQSVVCSCYPLIPPPPLSRHTSTNTSQDEKKALTPNSLCLLRTNTYRGSLGQMQLSTAAKQLHLSPISVIWPHSTRYGVKNPRERVRGGGGLKSICRLVGSIDSLCLAMLLLGLVKGMFVC